MPDYSKGLIYKLISNDISITEKYIGSCCDYNERKGQHEKDCNNINRPHYNNYKYRFIREHGGIDNWSMIIIKEFPCNSKRELEYEETVQMDLIGGELNTYRPFTTEEERKEQKKKYYYENKEKNKERVRLYYYENKEEIKERGRLYKNKKFECECGGKYTQSNKTQHIKSKKHINYIT